MVNIAVIQSGLLGDLGVRSFWTMPRKGESLELDNKVLKIIDIRHLEYGSRKELIGNSTVVVSAIVFVE